MLISALKQYFLLLFLFVPGFLFAQKQSQERIDSLTVALSKAKEDTNKVNILVGLAKATSNDPENSIKRGRQALALAQKLQWKKGIGNGLGALVYAYYIKGDYKTALDYCNKSLEQFNELNDYDGIIHMLRNSGTIYNALHDSANYYKSRTLWIRMAEKAGNKKDVIDGYTTWGNDFANAGDYHKSIEFWKKGLDIESQMPYTEHSTLLENIAKAYLLLHDGATARIYYTRLLNNSKTINNLSWVGQSYCYLAKCNREEKKVANFDQVNYYLTAFSFFKKINDKYWMALSYDMAGATYNDMAIYDKAIDFFLKSLKIAEDLNDDAVYPSILNDLTLVYQKTGDYDKALEKLFLAKQRFEKVSDKSFLAVIYENIGCIYRGKKDYQRAEENLQLALKTGSETGKPADLVEMLNDLGVVYSDQKKYDQALHYYYRALKLNLEMGNEYSSCSNLGNIGAAYLFLAKDSTRYQMPDSLKNIAQKILVDRAIRKLNESSLIAQKLNRYNVLLENYQHLSEAQEMSGDYKGALKNFKQYKTLQDSLFSNEKVKSITSLDLKYDFDKKEAATRAQHDKEAALRQTRLKYGGAAGAALLFIIFGGIYFYRRREQDKLQLQLLEVKQEALNARMSDHFISNTMDSINGFINENDKEKASRYLILFSRLIRKVLENASEKMIPLQDDLAILKDYLELEKLRFTGKLQYEIDNVDGVDFENTLIPPMIFQTLAENAIKHGLSKSLDGKLVLRVARKDNSIECVVEDNGMGRKAASAAKENAFPNQPRKSYGTSLAESLVKTGSKFAKDTSYKVIDLVDDRQQPMGTRVVFTLPYIVSE